MQWIVSSSVLIAAVIALRYLLRGRMGLRAQYALWLLVLVRLLVPVSFGTSTLSVANAMPERAPVVMTDHAGTPGAEQGSTFTPSAVPEFNGMVRPSAPTNAAPSAPAEQETAREIDYAALARSAWLLGAAALGVTFLAANLRFARRLRRTRTALDGTGAALAVYETAETETPCLFGLVRPDIYVTRETVGDSETLRYALAHEQTHYRHGDHVWAVLRGVCLALHWYNPLVWWAAELSRRDAELACDEATIRALGESERAAYGRTLLRMTCEKRPALLVTATTMTDNGRGLRERITLLVKKPKTAAYTAVAVVLIALIAVVCTFTGRETKLSDPFGKTYPAAEIVYDAPVYSMTFTEDTMPSVLLEQTSVTLRDYTACDYAYSSPGELTLTAENFDALFVDAEDGTTGWVDGKTSAAKLRGNNAKAWSCMAQEAQDGLPNLLYFLQQKDGTLYLALGYDAEVTGGAAHFRWLLRLGTAEDTNTLETWESMEAYVLARTKALKAPDGYNYTIIPEGHDGSDGEYEWVTEAAEDVRVRELRLDAACEGLSPDGVLELWYFDYEVKPVDAAGLLPERYYWVGDNSISDDGYISDSFYDVLTVLHRADGSYQILSEARMNDGNWYNGSAYESGSEYLYDFYVDYANLDLPRYYNKQGCHRYDGDGWYLYAPTMAWNHTTSGTREEWYSAYLTGSTVRVQKSSDSAAVWEQGYLESGYTLEQQTENPALSGPWYRTESDGTEYALYLAAAADGGSYLITTFWTPKGGNTVGTWAAGEQEQLVESEVKMLRAMAESFTVGAAPASGAAQTTQQKPQKVVLLADGAAVDMQLYRGEGWSVYAPLDWAYTPQWKQWTAPDGAEAHFSINENTASMENTKAYYAQLGAWPFETDMPAPLDYFYHVSGGYDAAAGYAHEELYFIPVDESRSYTLSCYSVNGTTSARDKLILRAMAQSFTLGEVSGGVDANAPTFESDWAMLDGVENFASFLVLSKDGTELGSYSLLNTWNKPQLNSYVFAGTTAPDLSGRMKLTLHLANNDASYFEFYEGTNTVGYFHAGSAEYYAVSNDFAVGDGVGLYDQFRGWYDEAELATLREEAVKPIPDRGQTWEEAAQEWLDAYEGVHLKVTSGSRYKFTWLKTAVEPAEDMTEFYREQGGADENTYGFYSKTAFVAESERALNYAMAGNTGPCTISGAPEGAFEYTRCCTITRTADGWVGAMGGTGW